MMWGVQDLIVSGLAAAAMALLVRTLWRAGRRSSPCEHCPKVRAVMRETAVDRRWRA